VASVEKADARSRVDPSGRDAYLKTKRINSLRVAAGQRNVVPPEISAKRLRDAPHFRVIRARNGEVVLNPATAADRSANAATTLQPAPGFAVEIVTTRSPST
jgi:hypothetical protein